MSDPGDGTEIAKRPLLMVSESRRNADMYYATRFLVSDPIIYLCDLPEERELLVVPQMEFERAKKESKVKEIRSTLEYGRDLKLEELLAAIFQDERLKAVEVPRYFSLYTAEELRKQGIEVVPVEDVPLTKAREVKSAQELRYVNKAQRACEKAMAVALRTIRSAQVKGGVLRVEDGVLTSEGLRAAIEHTLLDAGCTCDSGEPIVSSGTSTADPHSVGSGPLLADEPIILDIFPRLKRERYFADMTRTVVNGEPTQAIREMYLAVLEAQNAALALVKAGVRCREVHYCVCDLLEARGYETLRKGGRKGFIHSTGHGVGLNVHENPRVGDNEQVLRRGAVITLEPGLYEPDLGGVRVEDMVLVLEHGCENLTRFEKKLVL
jgi:Xaa-Pro aminopeptidase